MFLRLAILLCLFLPASAVAESLTILHINDHHSRLRADSRMSLILDGERTRVRSGGFPMVAAKVKALSAGRDDVLKLHAGDAITGDLYYTLFKGEADAVLMNLVCFDAFVVGNHEFDDGDAGLKNFLDHLAKGRCGTPVLGANVVPEVGVSPLTPNSPTDYIRPFAVKEVAGHRVGIIGIDIAKKTKNSSSPDETTIFLDEAETAQKYIDRLTAEGVERIVLLTHYQYRNDLALAARLTGVDVIVGGDSHTLLGDFKQVGLGSAGPYPAKVAGGDGNTVCVVQAWHYSQVVGELTVSFDDTGRVTSCSGTPHMMLADSFKRRNAEGDRVELEGAEREAARQAVAAHPNLTLMTEDPEAAALLAGFSEKVDVLKNSIVGQAAERLCRGRIPGQGKPNPCGTQGSDIANLVAYAMRHMSRTGEIAIQNAGGVRTAVAEGDFSIGDAYLLLPWSNTLVEVNLTGAELHAALEDALDYAMGPDGSTGAYPYAAGLRWSVDFSKPKGQRFADLETRLPGEAGWTPLDRARTYRLITNSYIAGGKDGYVTLGEISKQGRTTDTYLVDAEVFVEFVREVGTLRRLPAADYSTQAFSR